MSDLEKAIDKRLGELQKCCKLLEYLKNQETSNKTATSNNPSKPVTEELSVRDLCLKFHFVTGIDDAPLRHDILNVFKYMSKGFDKVCEIYLKSLHRLLSAQISDSFRLITEKNISYLLIGDNSQFVLFPKDNVNNFKQTHKKLILEHACNFYNLSIEKKEHVFTKLLKKRKQTKEEDVKVQGDTLRSSNDLKDNSGSILGKRKPSESLQSDIVENKKRKKETKQRIPKNKRVDDQIEVICDGEDLSDGKQEPTVTEGKVTKLKVTTANEAEAKDSKQITVTEVKNSKETNVTEANVTEAKVTEKNVTEEKDSSKERDSTVTEAKVTEKNVTEEKDSSNGIDSTVTEEKDSSKGIDSTVTEEKDSSKGIDSTVTEAKDSSVTEEKDSSKGIDSTVTEAKDSSVTEEKDSSKGIDSTVTEAKDSSVTEEKDSCKGRDSTVTEDKDSIKERNPAVNKPQDHNVYEDNDYDSDNSSDSLVFNLRNEKLNMTSLFGYELGNFDDE
jgi:hypothetical protein